MTHQETIKTIVHEAGFELCGFTGAVLNETDKVNLNKWIGNHLFGAMAWFPRNNLIRTEFANLGFVPKSVISLGIVYNPAEYNSVFSKFGFSFSRYAVGLDYHEVIKKRLQPVMSYLQEKYPGQHFRPATDSLPVAEKVLAKTAGLGWQGKHTNMVNESYGSWFFLAEIITDMEFAYDQPVKDRCGTCTRCITACPTGAIFAPYQLDAGRCISHATIEDRSTAINLETHGWIYGCDICQSVCPWNAKAERQGRYSAAPEFAVADFFKNHSESEILSLDEAAFRETFKKSAVSRINWDQFKRNVQKYLSGTT